MTFGRIDEISDRFDKIRDMVNNISINNLSDAEMSFQNILADKIASALDAKKTEIASTVYGGTPSATNTDDSIDTTSIENSQSTESEE